MPFRGRHRVILLFWPWSGEPFATTVDIAQCSVTKGETTGGSARFSLFPRNIPRGNGRDPNQGYKDVLAPDDWVFAYVDPADGDVPDPLFLGFIDRCAKNMSTDTKGRRSYSIEVSCDGWDKALKNTGAIANAWISEHIGMPGLIALSPAGANRGPRSRGASQRTPGVGLYQDTLPYVIEWLLSIFLIAEDRVAPVADEVEASIDSEIEDVSGTSDDGEEEEEGPARARPIMGQFELPGVGAPLWNFITLFFEDLSQRAYIDPSMFATQSVTSLAGLIDAFANTLINALIYDTRRLSDNGLGDLGGRLDRQVEGGYNQDDVERFINAARGVGESALGLVEDVSPIIIFRKRPLFVDELLETEGPTLDEKDFTHLDVGSSDTDLHNLTIISTPNLTGPNIARLSSDFAGFTEYRERTFESIRRHGLRLYEDRTMAWPGDTTAAHQSAELAREWETRLHLAGLDNVENWSGQVVIPKYVRGLFLGGSLTILHRNEQTQEREPARIYYVDSLDYTYNALGAFATKVKLTRGQVVE